MDDLISRRQAIDALKQQADTMSEWPERYAEQRKGVLTAVNIVEDLPPAQPEIIFCKDCKHSDIYPKGADNDMPLKCLGIRYGGVMPDWYCEHAERRA